MLRGVQFIMFFIGFYVTGVIIFGEFLPLTLHKNIMYLPGQTGYMSESMQDLRKTTDVDILFLGSSRCFRGFDVRIFDSLGLTSFNLGSHSQTPIQTKVLLDRYLSRLSPKIIVFEVNIDIMSDDGTESAIELISNDLLDLPLLKMVFDIPNFKVFNTYVFATYKKLVGSHMTIPNKEIYRDNYIKNGFVEYKDQTYIRDIDFPYGCNISSKQHETLDDILVMIRNHKIELYLVQSPISQKLYRSCDNNDNFDKLMKSKGNYLNFNDIMSLNDSLDFRDDLHLNQKGVEKFNRRLIEIIF